MISLPNLLDLYAIAEGFRQTAKDDFVNMSKQFYVYDALYASCKAKLEQGKVLAHRSGERR